MITLSASTWILDPLTPKTPYDVKSALSTYRAAGFECVDFNLWNFSYQGMPLAEDNWRAWVEQMRAHCDEIGLRVHQVHGATVNGKAWDAPDGEDVAHMNAMNYRCVEAAKILGAEWMVMHPFNLPRDPLYSRKKGLDANLAYLAPFIDAAKKAGVGIAVENMVDFVGSRRRYCGGDPDELMELVDAINDPAVGICLDTGHAHIAGIDNAAFIRMLGNRLKCTHINDNRRDCDTHMPPYFGTVDWQEVMQAFREIDYKGDFSFELSAQRFPAETRDTWCKFIRDLGVDMMKT